MGWCFVKILKLEKTQAQCLKTLVGAHKHSASDAVEALSEVTPMRLRPRELCIREFFKIKSKKRSNLLVSYLEMQKQSKASSLPYPTSKVHQEI